MATDPPAPDLGALRARLDALVHGEAPYTLGPYRVDLRAFIAAYDKQVEEIARLDAMHAAVCKLNDAQAARLAAVEAAARGMLHVWDSTADILMDVTLMDGFTAKMQVDHLRKLVAALVDHTGEEKHQEDDQEQG